MPRVWEPGLTACTRAPALQRELAAVSGLAQAVVAWRSAAAAAAEASGWPAAPAGPQAALLLDAGLSAVLRPSWDQVRLQGPAPGGTSRS